MRSFQFGALIALRLNFWIVLGSMIGFGSMAQSVDLNLSIAIAATLGIWGMPGQVAMIELFSIGAPLLAIVSASSLANLRFMPMMVVMMPLFKNNNNAYNLRFLIAQVMSINIWSITMLKVPNLAINERLPFYFGVSSVCLTGGIIGTTIGYFLAEKMPIYITLSLVFLNPAYFIFVFSSVENRNCIIAVILGAFFGPIIHLFTPEWGTTVSGVIAGTTAFYLDQLFKNKRRNNNV